MDPDWNDPFDNRELPGFVNILLVVALVAIAGFVIHNWEAIVRFFTILFSVLFGIAVVSCLVWCIRAIRDIHQEQQKAARAEVARQIELQKAYKRATTARWAMWPINPEASAKFRQIIAQHGFNYPDVAITVDRVRLLAEDVRICRLEWPHNEKLYQLSLRVAVLAASVSKYESAVRAFQKRDLAKAWRLVNRLPGPDPDDPDKITFLQFIYLWGVISREYYTAMAPEFTTGQVSPYLLDALGIDIPGQLLYELQSMFHSGRPPSGQLLAQVEHLRGRTVKTYNESLPKWGLWFPLLGPQTLAVLDRGMEGFIAYLLAVTLARPFKE